MSSEHKSTYNKRAYIVKSINDQKTEIAILSTQTEADEYAGFLAKMYNNRQYNVTKAIRHGGLISPSVEVLKLNELEKIRLHPDAKTLKQYSVSWHTGEFVGLSMAANAENAKRNLGFYNTEYVVAEEV